MKSQKKFWRDFESLSKSKEIENCQSPKSNKNTTFKRKLKQQVNVQSQIKTLHFKGKLRV